MHAHLQGTSGLSLIAAAAAVVSPTLSRNAGSGKHPMVSPVRAPRGRPPNKYRGGAGGNSTIKLSPTLLSPAGGSSANVLLSDIKNTAFRNRTRSAPSDRSKSSTIHLPRTGSTLARMSLSSSTGRAKSAAPTLPPGKRGDTSSLKSMIALQPSQGANSAFEALVNVAVAAPPVELPKTSSTVLTARGGIAKKPSVARGSTSTPSPVGTFSGKLTLSRSNSNDSNNSSLSNGATATAYIDVSQAINILATLAQQNPACSGHTISVYPGQPLIAQAGGASTIIGSIVSQGAPKQYPICGTAASISATSNPVSVSATVDTLLSHLTSGVGKGNSRNTPSLKPANRTKKMAKTEPVKTDGPVATNSDDLSNLKLLSSLVAAVAATQSSPSVTTPSVDISTVNTPALVTPTPTTKTQGSPSSGHSLVSEHSDSTNCTPLDNHNNNIDDSVSLSDDLPRSVVRPNPYPPPAARPPAVPGAADMTASLASIIPSYNPSVGQQSSLLLYTRSRTFPQSVDSVGEDEDTLESATRGISELSKLLGTEGNGESEPPIVGKKLRDVEATDELESVATNGVPMTAHGRGEFPNEDEDSSPHIKLNLSSLLESRSTAHHTSPGSHGNALSGEPPLKINTQSR